MAVLERTPEQLAATALASLRLVLLLLATAAGGVIALVFLSRGAVVGPWPLVAALLVVATGALSWWIWRCPRCRGHLGTQIFVEQCPQCAIQLRSRGPARGALPERH